MTDSADSETKCARKHLEERTNQIIEKLQESRESTNDDIKNCKSFVHEQISAMFAELEEDRKTRVANTDRVIQQSLMDLMSMLEKIDGLLGEIDTCKSTVNKLNSLLLHEEKDNQVMR
ncbi:hypothetical protein EG68_10842 [Paragonimus skrjabini miyazakii]|uniref:Uncharacterized protein n=1 Tax=Paragonimus skrjabini miyazakii TaxID=59628 RepID=A0A8S9YGE0_9TREM|nr:hypothetical protein EG68_10842 [Paragonimus skrjabini miyazakii]